MARSAHSDTNAGGTYPVTGTRVAPAILSAAAAKVLGTLLDKLLSLSARGRGGWLAEMRRWRLENPLNEGRQWLAAVLFDDWLARYPNA
jgi:hypothetical protein